MANIIKSYNPRSQQQKVLESSPICAGIPTLCFKPTSN